jgi:NAD-dependent DNA ligase
MSRTDWRNRPRVVAGMTDGVVEAIFRRRRQLLVHACVYYALNGNLITDHTWDRWSLQLAKLQRKYGWRVGFYDYTFKNWQGGTGFQLPYHDATHVAQRLLARQREKHALLGD